MSAYAALEARFKKLSDIGGALAVLSWDQSVIMPKGGSTKRGEQMAALQGISHEILTADETGELIDAAGAEALDDWQQSNLREIGRRYQQATALSGDLVQAMARATNACEMTWREAREKSDFAMLRPELEEVVRLVREAAVARGEKLGLATYDALLESFQPGLRSTFVDRLFAELGERLPGIADSAIASQKDAVLPKGPFAIENQRKLAKELMSGLGFDFDRGRLDESVHPFCGGTPADIRITTRYDEGEVASAIMAVMHETGHALYEAGLPLKWREQPVGDARGMAVHESQSLLVEMQACRSPAFIGFLAGKLSARFPGNAALNVDNLVRLYSHVARSLIRVDADEVTYPLHIVLRYRLEQALLSGDLEVSDLPGAWSDGLYDLLGVRPGNDRDGCMQDIHWPIGAFGYFPNYTLGALLAAQLFKTARQALPDLMEHIAAGDFAPLMAWLREQIHSQGSFLEMDQLVRQATGKPLGCEDFLEHVGARYRGAHSIFG